MNKWIDEHYPYRVNVPKRIWSPAVTMWLKSHLDRKNWFIYENPDTPYDSRGLTRIVVNTDYIYAFSDSEDAVAFKLALNWEVK